MKVTEGMESAFISAAHGDGSQVTEDVHAGLVAVLKVIDPVPEDVDTITDEDGDEWYRNLEDLKQDSRVWIYRNDPSMFGTYQNIEELYGPITWEGK